MLTAILLMGFIMHLTERAYLTPQLDAALQGLEQKMPVLLPWLVPHFVRAGVGLALVLLVAFTFKRFRNVLNG